MARALLPQTRMNRTVRGIGIRAVILVIGILLVGFWLLSLAFKIAGGLIHIALAIGLVLVAVAAFSIAARKFKRRD